MKRIYYCLLIALLLICCIALFNSSDNDDHFDDDDLKMRARPMERRFNVIELNHDYLDADEMSFVLAWTTPASTFKSRHYAAIDSIFFHHPEASVRVYSSTLHAIEHFGRYLDAGYRLSVVPLADEVLAEMVPRGLQMNPFFNALSQCNRDDDHAPKEESSSCTFIYSHLSDFLRFAVLYALGGTYMDFDALAMRPLGHYRNAIGADSSQAGGACHWCLADGDTYLAPGVLINWVRGHPLLLEALRAGFERYDARCFNCAGPRAVTAAFKAVRAHGPALREHVVHVLPPFSLYPVRFTHALEHCRRRNDTLPLLANVVENAVSLHMYGHTIGDARIESRSLFGLAMRRHALFSDAAARVEAPLSLAVAAHESVNVVRNVRIVLGAADGPVSLRIDAMHAALRVHAADSEAVQSLQLSGNNARDVNIQLSRLLYDSSSSGIGDGRDVLIFRMAGAMTRTVRLYELPRLVTMVAKTMGRVAQLDVLIDSARVLYPALPIIVADDGIDNDVDRSLYAASDEVPSVSALDHRRVPFDAGLSYCRNRLVEASRTPLVLIIDDDFTFDLASNVHTLVVNALEHGYDIAAAKNPVDAERFQLDFCGLMRVDDDDETMRLVRGSYGVDGDCEQVDFAPNLFLARVDALRAMGGWDERLKLGEHEDFFWRAKSADLKVGTCASVAFTHHQSEHWLKRTWYDMMRQRVYTFFQLAMRKHGVRRLELFGAVVAELDESQVIDVPVCSIGTAGSQCIECRDGYAGKHCSECAPHHFGIECKPCACVLGTCNDGIDGDGTCRCWSSSSEHGGDRDDDTGVDATCRRVPPLYTIALIALAVIALFICICVSESSLKRSKLANSVAKHV
jgi:Glycosyltransferase sugar-binding region containing DXD motif/Alpha 1,4-glycosyltransferase conserved region